MKTTITIERSDYVKLKSGECGFITAIRNYDRTFQLNKAWFPFDELEICAARRVDMYDNIIWIDEEPRPPKHLRVREEKPEEDKPKWKKHKKK